MRFRICAKMGKMQTKEKWPVHVHILIWVAVFTMFSSVAGNAIAWQQWKHPVPETGTKASKEPSSSGGAQVIIWPFLVSSVASIVSLGLLLAVVRKVSSGRSVDYGHNVALKNEHIDKEQPIPIKLGHVPRQGDSRARLEFKVRAGSPAVTIKKIGPLVSEELCRVEQSLHPLQGTFPELDPGESTECQIYADLAAALEQGGPMTVDSITVDYTVANDNGIRHSQYFLHKTAEGSIIFSTDRPHRDPKSLSDLRTRLLMLKDAIRSLSWLDLADALATESSAIVRFLDAARSRAVKEGDKSAIAALEYPLSTKLTGTVGPLVPWYIVELQRFHDMYRSYMDRSIGQNAVSAASCLKWAVGTDTASCKDVMDSLDQQQLLLSNLAHGVRTRYAAIANREVTKATISPMDQT